MAQTQLNVRLDSELLASSKDVLNNLGLTVQEAFKIFLKKVVNFQGIPFDLKLDYEPNKETRKAMFSDDRTEVKSINELWEQYENN